MAKAKVSKAVNKTKSNKKPVTRKSEPVKSNVSKNLGGFFAKPGNIKDELRLGALSAELLGTFVLTAAVIVTGGNFIVVAVTVLALVMVLGKLSGGHINPALTLAMFVTKQMSAWKTLGYLASQLLGAMLAVVVVTQFVMSGGEESGAQVFQLDTLTDTWKPMLAEMVGALVLGFSFAAVVFNKKDGHEAGLMLGGAFFVALLLAMSLGSTIAVLNPAVALGLSGYDLNNWWTVWVYAGGPVVGVAVGAWLYKLLLQDVTRK